MTLKQFFRRIRKDRTWLVYDWSGEVRCTDGRCPLGAADYNLAPAPTVRAAAKLLGLRLRDARKIADAADRSDSKYRPWLLKRLGIA